MGSGDSLSQACREPESPSNPQSQAKMTLPAYSCISWSLDVGWPREGCDLGWGSYLQERQTQRNSLSFPSLSSLNCFLSQRGQSLMLIELVLGFLSLPQRRALIIALLIYNFCFRISGPQLNTNTQNFILPSCCSQGLVILNRLQYLGGKDHDLCSCNTPWLSSYESTQMSNDLFLWLYDMP